MAFLGAIINVAKGVVTKTSNTKVIKDLEEELQKDLLDGLNEDEKIEAEIKLKEAELELAIINNKPRYHQSKIEREIIDLMEAKLKKKMEELKQKEATQLDIAKTMIAIQKTSNDMKDYIKKMDDELAKKMNEFFINADEKSKVIEKNMFSNMKKYDTKLDAIKRQNNTILSDLKSKSEKIEGMNVKLNNNIERLNTIEEQNVSMLLEIKTERTRINEMNSVIEAIKENISKNSKEIETNQQVFEKYKKVWVGLYITTMAIIGTSFWYFVIR